MRYKVRAFWRGQWVEYEYHTLAELMEDLRERDRVVSRGEPDAALIITAIDLIGAEMWSASCSSLEQMIPKVQAARFVWACNYERSEQCQ